MATQLLRFELNIETHDSTGPLPWEPQAIKTNVHKAFFLYAGKAVEGPLERWETQDYLWLRRKLMHA